MLQGEVGEFRQITRRISKTVQDRRIVSIKDEWEIVSALSNGGIADDLGWPQITPKHPHFVHFNAFLFSVTAEGRDFKFGG